MDHIRNISVSSERMSVKHTFVDSETEKMKDDFINRQVSITLLKEQLDAVKEEFKAKIKPLEQSQSETLTQIRSGFVEELKEVFLVPDFENGVMQYFTEDGTEVFSRKLRADEKQTNFLKLAAEGGR